MSKYTTELTSATSRLPGVGRRDHGDPVGVVGLEHAGDGDVEERLVGERRPAGADNDGQVGARVPARLQLLPVHRPELRLPRVALVQHRVGRDAGASAEEREHEEQRDAAGARETHHRRQQLPRPRASAAEMPTRARLRAGLLLF
jgi:hypothetical protein